MRMSKKSQREARERKEQSETERLLKFSTTLKGYLSTFGQLFRQEIGDEAAGAYQVTLSHLNPEELKLGCDEAIKRCKFFPNPAEILESLRMARERMDAFGHSPRGNECTLCGGCKWKVIHREGYGYAVPCDCRIHEQRVS